MLLSASMRFAGDYLSFAGVVCLPLAARWSEQLELLFVVVVLTGAEEKRERGSPVRSGPRPFSGWFSRLLAFKPSATKPNNSVSGEEPSPGAPHPVPKAVGVDDSKQD